MTDIKIAEINEKAIEPNEYFKVLKGGLKKTELTALQKQLDIIAEHIVLARNVGQKNFLKKLSFSYETIIKEQLLFTKGYKEFVFKDDVRQFLDKVTPKNSVKIIELERFPRSIPVANLKKIQEAQDLNIFDDYAVVFTDFTKDKHQTSADKKTIARNRDPIVFGYFEDKKENYYHDRFYFITDWEDEYCDLTFTKMIDKMSKQGIKNPKKEISTDHEYIMELINSFKSEEKEPEIKSETFWSKLWPSRKK